MEEEIIEALSEWPVTNSVYNQSSPLDKIDNPNSVSAFFLRNVGKSKVVSKKDKGEKVSCKTNSSPEVQAHIALSKWWRSEVSSEVKNSVSLPECSSPHTKIACIARSEPGLEFIYSEIKRLREKIPAGFKTDDVYSALASYYELIGNLNLAILHLETAIEKSPQDKEKRWRMLRLKKQLKIRSSQEELLKKISFSSSSVEKTMPIPKQIRQVSVDHLSFEDFFYNYALTNTPVVITGAVNRMTTVPWTFQHVKDLAGHHSVKLKKCVQDSVQWARLEDTEERNVGDFIDGLLDETRMPDPLYLFDWNLPVHCPELVNELVIPKYFAGDFLQRTSLKSYYRDSWPSLFIAPAGLTSELHVDSFGSNFWMALMQGKKRWLLFEPKDIPLLYPSYEHPASSDPVFNVDLKNPDILNYPLLAETQPIECILEAGELLFVPAGCPHRVENLETSLAISGNFVDLSNFDLVKEELGMTGLIHENSASLCDQLSCEDFPSKMKRSQEDLPWSQFKRWPPEDYSEYDITEQEVKERRQNKGHT